MRTMCYNAQLQFNFTLWTRNPMIGATDTCRALPDMATCDLRVLPIRVSIQDHIDTTTTGSGNERVL